MLRPAALIVVAGLLAGCVDPRSLETEPVHVKTPKGNVTCQLYTKDEVLWDRAIDRPGSMTVTDADTYCRQEGQRRLAL